MGCVENVDFYKFPKQSASVNMRCKVTFLYDTNRYIPGTIIRDDREEPFETLIRLDDGRIIRATECQYMICNEVKNDALELLKSQPEQKHGHWNISGEPPIMIKTCSECGVRIFHHSGSELERFCAWCGAKMDKGVKQDGHETINH